MSNNQKNLAKFVASYAKRQHLVFLGDVDQDDNHSKISGFLLQPKHRDYAYSQGHIQGIDVALVVRSVTLPNHSDIVTRMIIEFTLDQAFPHVIALGNEHDEAYFKALLARYHHYSRNDVGPWKVFAEATVMPEIAHLKDLLLRIHETGVADVELENTHLRLYLSESSIEEDIDRLVGYVRDLFAVQE